MVAIAFKIVERNDALNQLFKTSASGLPQIGRILLLWASLFLVRVGSGFAVITLTAFLLQFFAIFFTEVFGLTKVGPSSFSRNTNFRTFANALVLLSFCSTG